jgi:hypothetical protein
MHASILHFYDIRTSATGFFPIASLQKLYLFVFVLGREARCFFVRFFGLASFSFARCASYPPPPPPDGSSQ